MTSVFCMRWEILVFMLLLLPIAIAEDYYADVEIEVDDSGLVTIEGKTNHDKLNVQGSPEYTSKKAAYWVLNITTEEIFSDYIYELRLPKNAQVNYIKTAKLSRIDHSGKYINIIGTGEDKPFTLIVQYKIGQDTTHTILKTIAFAIVILISIVGFYIFMKEEKNYDPNTLSKRQLQILKIIEKSKKPVTQSFLEKKTKLPKSSLSRNIESLVRREIVLKEKAGMSNFLKMNEKSKK